MNVMKYLKVLLYIWIPAFIGNLFISIFYYINLIHSSIYYFKIFVMIISMLIGGFYIGRKAIKKGWLEGLKVGLEVIFLFFLIRYLGFDKGMNIKILIYYIILLASSIFGSMLGISMKKEIKS